jgi:hypothetical protein
MKTKNPLDGVVRFAEAHYPNAIAAHLAAHTETACAEAGTTTDQLPARLGQEVFAMLFTCVLEDVMTQPEDAEGPNLTDAFLKRNGWKLTPSARRHLQSVRDSSMGLYNVTDIDPDRGLELQDALQDGPRFVIHHPGLAGALPIGCALGARLLGLDGVTTVSGGILPIDAEFAAEAATAVAAGEGPLAPRITNFWLLKTLQEEKE